ncbi:MAG: hypothetical protein HFE61_09140 [Anaerotignum sp.]|nr:hypothetical protein [Anaerotignum sp.]
MVSPVRPTRILAPGSDGKFPFALAPLWKVLVKFIAPICIIVIIIAGMVLGMSIS